MALNSGFQRFEGSAYFGYDMEGEGYEVVVVIGQNVIEIRDLNDNPLSQWMAGTYRCNDQEIPLRAYFHGDEWLAPQDLELQEVLDRYTESPDQPSRTKGRNRFTWAWILLIIVALAVVSFFALRPLTKQLLSPAIRETLDDDIIQNHESQFAICNPALNATSHNKIAASTELPEFIVFPNMAQNYARLPTGKLAINGEFMQYLDNVQTLTSLLQLSEQKSQEQDPANELLSYLPLTARVTFLANAQIDQPKLETAWKEYAQNEAFSTSLYRSIREPLGDFSNLSSKLAWPEGEYASTPADVVLTDEEWLSLFTFCQKEE